MAFFHTPGLKLVYPVTPCAEKGLLKSAIRDEDPVLFFEHKRLYRAPTLREHLPNEDFTIPLGRARVHREGSDLTVVTYGAMVHETLAVAGRRSEERRVGKECRRVTGAR